MTKFACGLLVFVILSATVSFAQSTKKFVVHFQSDSASLSQAEISRLYGFIGKMKWSWQLQEISITAYCDDAGRSTYNDSLSNQRATFVGQAFSISMPDLMDIPIKYIGKGELATANKKNISAERALNRRAEITLTYKKPEVPAEKTVEKTAAKPIEEQVEKPVVKTIEKPVIKETPVTPKVKQGMLHDNQKVGDKVTLDNILFQNIRHSLLPESFPVLDTLVSVLQRKKEFSVMFVARPLASMALTLIQDCVTYRWQGQKPSTITW